MCFGHQEELFVGPKMAEKDVLLTHCRPNGKDRLKIVGTFFTAFKYHFQGKSGWLKVSVGRNFGESGVDHAFCKS